MPLRKFYAWDSLHRLPSPHLSLSGIFLSNAFSENFWILFTNFDRKSVKWAFPRSVEAHLYVAQIKILKKVFGLGSSIS